MNKFIIKGSYDVNYDHIEANNTIEVIVPLISNDGKLKWGVDKLLKKLTNNSIFPSEQGIDLLCLAALVYLADTRISRQVHSQNSWTREISIELPVVNPELWNQHSNLFVDMLNFLTGDRWEISFVKRNRNLMGYEDDLEDRAKFNTATLFSGGMDSLINVINHLEEKHKVILISHAGDGNTKNAQEKLLKKFKEHYHSELQPLFCDLWMVFDKEIIPNGGVENTTRSRSFLFIALGSCVLSAFNHKTVLEIPENGLIALNVPLDDLRIGAHSTHTTHPYYLGLWNTILDSIGETITLNNDFGTMTKGEMAEQCKNKELLQNVIVDSISCSSMTKARWSGNTPQHCGHCVPCIIRRAAMHKAFLGADSTVYTEININSLLQNHAKGVGIQLRSFQMAISRINNNPQLAKLLIYKSGQLVGSNDYLEELAEVYLRGLMEVDKFIQDNIKTESIDI